MLPGYFKGIEEAGGLPVMLPLTTDGVALGQLVQELDGLLLTGGQDVSPLLYGEEPLPECGAACLERDEMESLLLAAALKENKPILGICRGIQFLNAALGGTLHQDLPTQWPSGVEHHQTPPYNRPVHQVSIQRGSPLHRLLGVEQLAVNSYHHQAVKTLAPRLEVMATSEDGLVEAVFLPECPFVWAVQWHPEFSFEIDPRSRKIFHAFLEAAGSN